MIKSLKESKKLSDAGWYVQNIFVDRFDHCCEYFSHAVFLVAKTLQRTKNVWFRLCI